MISSLGWAKTGGIVPCGRGCVGWKRGTTPFLVIAGVGAPATGSSSSGAEQLRTQLDLLREEAELTRSKANSARLRLLRLSEAAEKLRRRAAVDIQNGKENEARELLLQKKKVMQALDRSKNRIELLDDLSSKLNEAISLKEEQLIGNLTQMEFSTDDAEQPVHIISPSDAVGEDSDPSVLFNSSTPSESVREDSNAGELVNSSSQLDAVEQLINLSSPGDAAAEDSETSERIEINSRPDDEVDAARENLQRLDEETGRSTSMDGDEKGNFLREVTCFDDFLRHVDGHLREVETDLALLLKSSALLMENEQKQKSPRAQQASLILGDISRTRRRIASIMEAKSDDSNLDQSDQHPIDPAEAPINPTNQT